MKKQKLEIRWYCWTVYGGGNSFFSTKKSAERDAQCCAIKVDCFLKVTYDLISNEPVKFALIKK